MVIKVSKLSRMAEMHWNSLPIARAVAVDALLQALAVTRRAKGLSLQHGIVERLPVQIAPPLARQACQEPFSTALFARRHHLRLPSGIWEM